MYIASKRKESGAIRIIVFSAMSEAILLYTVQQGRSKRGAQIVFTINFHHTWVIIMPVYGNNCSQYVSCPSLTTALTVVYIYQTHTSVGLLRLRIPRVQRSHARFLSTSLHTSPSYLIRLISIEILVCQIKPASHAPSSEYAVCKRKFGHL